MNKKLFKGALVLFASILMAVSCQSNSNPDDGNGNGAGSSDGNGPGTQKKEVTVTYAKFLEELKKLKIGAKSSDTGEFDLTTITGIKTGQAKQDSGDTEANITATGASSGTSKENFKKALKAQIATLEKTANVTVTVTSKGESTIGSAAQANGIAVEFAVAPKAETSTEKYVLEEALTKALSSGKFTIKFTPQNSNNWN